MKFVFKLFLVVLFFAGTNQAQITSSEVDQLVETALKKFTVAGMAIAIVKDGKVIHSRGYGVKSVFSKRPVDQHTQFAIASNTKAFTTAALSILVDQKKLHWTDKVKDHIPEFKMYNSYVTENFNIQDLLTHRSGLGLGAGDLIFFPDGSDFTIADVLTMFQHFKPQSAFRTKFDYDNLLYKVAGEVIARVSGISYEAFIKQHIFEPLGMTNTYASLTYIKDKKNLSAAHKKVGNIAMIIKNYISDPNKMNGAAGAIYSSVDDLTKWMMLHLNKGKYGDNLQKQLFSEQNHYEMWKIHTTLNTNHGPRYNSHFNGYGLGWGLLDIKGNLMATHTGGLPGMLSRTTLIPDLNLGIVILTNTSPDGGAAFTAITRTLVDRYLGLDDYGWIDKLHEQLSKNQSSGDKITGDVWDAVARANADHINVDDYIGVYEDKWFGKVEVYKESDELWIKSHRSPKLTGQMNFYKANTFAIRWIYQDENADAFAMFNLDQNGKAIDIKMKGISPNIDFSFDFQDLDLIRVNK